MKNFSFLTALILLAGLLTSCNKESVDYGNNQTVNAQNRAAQGIDLEITTSGNSKVSVHAVSASVGSVSSGTFLVTVYDGSNTQTYTATTLVATHDGDGLRVTKYVPSLTVYSYKSNATITAIGSELQCSLNPGAINFGTTAIVVEEMDGI